ncbi:polysaccharide pyruvyl transferase family protein [Shewanella frigidimarina]|uniref:polysaccharide pyruvyl transferase family protein n=1 Tax=Shewanella frigidimarina TaxID=56812 RepID=UPI003FA04EA9
MKDSFDDLANEIKKRSEGKTVIYFANPGNFGDGLIRYSTKKFFYDYGIKHEEYTLRTHRVYLSLLPFVFNIKKFFFIYGGGGAWCKNYRFANDFYNILSRFTSDILVLPSTYELKQNKVKGVIYRRDNFESKLNAPASLFCHDMAFYLTTCKESIIKKPMFREGNLFRTDIESSGHEVKNDNVDLSTKGDYLSNGDIFLEEISRYEVINTDRLHVCIGAIHLGLEVNLFPGNYFKIKSIYKTSIEEYFNKVNFLER